MHLFWKTLNFKNIYWQHSYKERWSLSHHACTSLFNLPAHLTFCKWNKHELQKWKKNLKLACLCMRACEYIYCTSLQVAHQHTEPANWASWFCRSPDTLQSSSNIQPSLLCLRSREDSYWWRYTNRTHALSSRCANAAKRLQICKSVSAECVKNTSRNPLVYWKCNEHLRTLWKTEICSWGGPDMWVYPPAAVA